MFSLRKDANGGNLATGCEVTPPTWFDAIAERHDMRAFGRIMTPVFTTAALDVMARMFIIGCQGLMAGIYASRTSSSNETNGYFVASYR